MHRHYSEPYTVYSIHRGSLLAFTITHQKLSNFIHDHIKHLSGFCHHSAVLKHSYHAVLHTYFHAVTPPRFHLACLRPSFGLHNNHQLAQSSPFCPRPIIGDSQNNTNNFKPIKRRYQQTQEPTLV